MNTAEAGSGTLDLEARSSIRIYFNRVCRHESGRQDPWSIVEDLLRGKTHNNAWGSSVYPRCG